MTTRSVGEWLASGCPDCGSALRDCSSDNPGCLHCTECCWCGHADDLQAEPPFPESRAVIEDMVERLLAEDEQGVAGAGIAALLVACGPSALKPSDVPAAKEYLRSALPRWRETDPKFAERERRAFVAEQGHGQ